MGLGGGEEEEEAPRPPPPPGPRGRGLLGRARELGMRIVTVAGPSGPASPERSQPPSSRSTRARDEELLAAPYPVHTAVEYTHYLVPDLAAISAAPYYWGVMDRFEAEKLLEGKPEGSFLLRDSAQSEYMFRLAAPCPSLIPQHSSTVPVQRVIPALPADSPRPHRADEPPLQL